MISHSQYSHENQHYRDRINALYARGVKAFGEQESVMDTHKSLLDIFNGCIELTTEISNAKQIARELPRRRPKDLGAVLLGQSDPPQEIIDEGFHTIEVLFESCISLIEQHVRNGDAAHHNR